MYYSIRFYCGLCRYDLVSSSLINQLLKQLLGLQNKFGLARMAFRGLIRSLLFTRQLHVISKSSCYVKPASPTPSYLKRYNIPLFDRMAADFYIPMIFFYPNSDRIPKPIPKNASDLLKKSLSETLSKYYPFAGRLRSGSYVDCNDQGVHFVDAEIGCNLSEVLETPPVKEQEDGLGHLFPPRTIWDQSSELYPGIIMLVQLNHFACGGIAVAASLSHRLGDALTLCTFLRYWATLSLHSGDHHKLLHLCPHLVYEQLPLSYDVDSIKSLTFPNKHWKTKELVFPNTKLAQLKVAVNNQDKLDGLVEDQKYSRNELLTSLLYRCLVAAAARTDTGAQVGSSVLARLVNMRPMIDPPQPETSVGNFMLANHIITSTEVDTKYRTLVARMRKEKRQIKGIKSLQGHEMETVLPEFKNKCRLYIISSMCNFPVYDVMDFGFGKPIKAALVDTPMADTITLMDTANDGIRAVVGLEEQDMNNFLAQKELFTYASF